jgi:hypothetical protein
VVDTLGGAIAAMCPADSATMNRIILNEGLYIVAFSGSHPRALRLLVIGTASV